MRRPRPHRVFRPETHRRLPEPVAGLGRGQRAGTGATSSTSRCCRTWRRSMSSISTCRSSSSTEGLAAGRVVRLRQDLDPVHLCQRTRPHRDPRAHLRRRGHQPAAALPRNRFDGRQGGTGEVHQRKAVPVVRRRAPARGSALCQGRHRQAAARHLRGRAQTAARMPGVLREAHPQGRQERDRRPRGQGNHLAPEVPQQRGTRLPVARPQRRYLVRRRGATHPPGLANRLRPDRRDVRAR